MDLTLPTSAHPAASAEAFSECWQRAQRVEGQQVDAEQKALTLRRQFATTSWLQNTIPKWLNLLAQMNYTHRKSIVLN